MIAKKGSRIAHENSKSCTAYEYSLNDKDIDVALIRIDGRYPDAGFVFNEKVKELSFVAKGRGSITVDGKTREIEEGDAVLILPGQKYYFNGSLELVVSCTPAWSPEQHRQSIE